MTLLVVSIWLKKLGRPFVYTLVPMLFVGTATLIAMLGELRGYFANFSDQWLLAATGGLILALDIWVLFVGLRMLATNAEPRTESG